MTARRPVGGCGGVADQDRCRDLLDLLAAALVAVDPEAATERALHALDPPLGGRVGVVAFGKAAAGMARAAARVLGESMVTCLVVSDHLEPVPDGAELIVTAHPLPTGASVAAGRRLLETVAGDHDHVLALVSGGGSAVVEVPAAGLALADLVAANQAMLLAGIPIEAVNTVRSHLSSLKGGRLAVAATAPVTTVLVSDIADRPHLVASGPTVPCPSGPDDALAVITHHDLGGRLPATVMALLADAPLPPVPPPGRVVVAVDGTTARAAALVAARHRGWSVVAGHPLTGDAAEAARAAVGGAVAGAVTVHTGETTVSVTGGGRGGRNQHAAVAAALAIEGQADVAFAAFATDGVDGPTDAAGAIVDGTSADRMRAAGFDPQVALGTHDTHPALDAIGALVRSGPTGANVADLWLVDRRRTGGV